MLCSSGLFHSRISLEATEDDVPISHLGCPRGTSSGVLYDEEFKFVSRKKRKVAMFSDDDPYCEAVFGAFPHSKSLNYLKKAFVDVCEPDLLPVNAATSLRLLKEGHFTPLHVGLHELDVTFENHEDPIIFVFNPDKAVDLIDYWNLRQFQASVFPVSVHWFDQFAETIRKTVTANFRPVPNNKNGVMISNNN